MSTSFGPPVPMGRRVGARVLEAALTLVVAAVLQVGLLASAVGEAWGYPLVAVGLAWIALELWTLLGRAAMVGQWLLGVCHVDAATGRRAGGRTFLKYLIQLCTFGLAPLITPLTIQAPNRSWFDRTAGVTMVRTRPAGATAAPAAQVAAPPQGWREDDSSLTRVGVPAAPGAPGTPSGGPMITPLPFDVGRTPSVPAAVPVDRAAPAVVAPAPAAPQVQPPPVQPPPVQPAAVQPPPAPPAPVAGFTLVLGTGAQYPLSTTYVVGRAPRAVTSLGTTSLLGVDDQQVSANHLAVGTDGSGPWVMDLRSTNGVNVRTGQGASVRIEPLVRRPLGPEDVVEFGRSTLLVRRA